MLRSLNDRNRLAHYYFLLSICAIYVLSLAFGPAIYRANAADLTRTHTESQILANDVDNQGHLLNAMLALKLLQRFFDYVDFRQGVDYSFFHDVLGNSVSREQGFVLARDGSIGSGVGDAASLLNRLVSRTRFWDGSSTRPVFEVVHASIAENQSDAYAVQFRATTSDTPGSDYVWRLSQGYAGRTPEIVTAYDAQSHTASMVITYSDAASPAPETGSPVSDLIAALDQRIGDRRLGVAVIPIEHPEQEFGINQNIQVPSASAWKGPGLLYFFDQTPPEVWRSIPVKYWNTRNVARVPIEYQAAWLQYHEILRSVYVMTVFSGNHEAANVLAYVFENTQHDQTTNPIRAFNDWTRQHLKISAESGLYAWQYGNLTAANYTDARFLRRFVYTSGQKELFFSSTFSARDFALAYYYLATTGKERGYYDRAVELLSVRTDIISKIEGQLADHPEVQSATKDGYFSPDSENSLGHDVNNDAGLLILLDGRRYALAVTAFDAVDIESEITGMVIQYIFTADQAAEPAVAAP